MSRPALIRIRPFRARLLGSFSGYRAVDALRLWTIYAAKAPGWHHTYVFFFARIQAHHSGGYKKTADNQRWYTKYRSERVRGRWRPRYVGMDRVE